MKEMPPFAHIISNHKEYSGNYRHRYHLCHGHKHDKEKLYVNRVAALEAAAKTAEEEEKEEPEQE